MSIKPFAYARASSIHDAVTALDASTRPLAGGTDLVPLMKDGLATPERLVSLSAISDLSRIAVQRDRLVIGAGATLAQLALDPLVANSPGLGALKEAILEAASPQIRHMATIGGNLVQAPRCWYYRNPKTPCWRKGGRMCYAFRGENKGHVLFDGGPCYAVHPSDPAVALMALDASISVAGPLSDRDLPLSAFYRKPDRASRSDNVLAEDEIITALNVPLPAEGSTGAYVKVAERQTWDFALVSAAVLLSYQGPAVGQAC